MGIVQFPVDRLTGHGVRSALRRGSVAITASRPPLHVVGVARPMLCAACAAPVDFAAVWRGADAFCSVECSLGGGRPA